jgi:hypothetical protein
MAKLKWLFSLAVACCLSACAKTEPSYTYRITVHVKDHGRDLIGTSVVEVSERTSGGRILVPRMCGESAVIRLSTGRILIALLDARHYQHDVMHPYWGMSPTMVLLNKLGFDSDWAENENGIRQLPEVRKQVRIEQAEWPEFVIFMDPNNANSMGPVYPDRQELALGPDIQISSVDLEIVNEPPTRGNVEKYLPWLKQRSGNLDGQRLSSSPYLTYDFTRCTSLFSRY